MKAVDEESEQETHTDNKIGLQKMETAQLRIDFKNVYG